MTERINLAQMSPKFAALQEALIKAKTPEEKIDIMVALFPEEKREEKRKILLAKLEERKAKQEAE